MRILATEIHPQLRGAAAQKGKTLWTVSPGLTCLCMKQQLLAPAELGTGKLLLAVPGVLCAPSPSNTSAVLCWLPDEQGWWPMLILKAYMKTIWTVCWNNPLLSIRLDILWCDFGIGASMLNQMGCILPSDIREWSNQSDSVHLYTISIEIALNKVCLTGKWDLTQQGLYRWRLGNECEATCHERVKKKNILQLKIKLNCFLNI